MEQIIGITIAIAALTSPVWVIYSVIKFAQWQESRKRTWGGIEAPQQFIDRLNARRKFGA